MGLKISFYFFPFYKNVTLNFRFFSIIIIFSSVMNLIQWPKIWKCISPKTIMVINQQFYLGFVFSTTFENIISKSTPFHISLRLYMGWKNSFYFLLSIKCKFTFWILSMILHRLDRNISFFFSCEPHSMTQDMKVYFPQNQFDLGFCPLYFWKDHFQIYDIP